MHKVHTLFCTLHNRINTSRTLDSGQSEGDNSNVEWLLKSFLQLTRSTILDIKKNNVEDRDCKMPSVLHKNVSFILNLDAKFAAVP